MALERLESTYKSRQLMSNFCVHAIIDTTQPIAITFPHEGHLRVALLDMGPRHFTWEPVCALQCQGVGTERVQRGGKEERV